MANVIILTHPTSVFVDQGSSSVTFSTSGTTVGTVLSGNSTVYQWYQRDTLSQTFTAIAGATSNNLTLLPLVEYDNDAFKAGLSAIGANQEVFTDIATFAIRLSADQYSAWETATETGANRVRRLIQLGYM